MSPDWDTLAVQPQKISLEIWCSESEIAKSACQTGHGLSNNEAVFRLRFRLPLIPLRSKVAAQAKGISNMKKTTKSVAATALTVMGMGGTLLAPINA